MVTPLVTPSRITLARRRRALSLAELAGRVDVSVQSLTHYESGRTRPRPATLEQLAQALDFPAEFFARPLLADVPGTTLTGRDPRGLSARAPEAARAAGVLAVELFGWIARHLTLPAQLVPDLAGMDPERAAERVRDRFRLGDEEPVANVLRALEAHGTRVLAPAPGGPRTGTFSFRHHSVPYVLVDAAAPHPRARMDAARELGHLVLHPDGIPAPGTAAQREAGRFARAFLVPAAVLSRKVTATSALGPVLDEARRWQVPAPAVVHRARELGLIAAERCRALCAELERCEAPAAAGPGTGVERERPLLPAAVQHRMRSTGLTPAAAAADLGISVAEFGRLLLGRGPGLDGLPRQCREQSRPAASGRLDGVTKEASR